MSDTVCVWVCVCVCVCVCVHVCEAETVIELEREEWPTQREWSKGTRDRRQYCKESWGRSTYSAQNPQGQKQSSDEASDLHFNKNDLLRAREMTESETRFKQTSLNRGIYTSAQRE